MNIKARITKQLQDIFLNHFNLKINETIFNVIYYGKHNVDYRMASLTIIIDYLKKVGIVITIDELFKIISSKFEDQLYIVTCSPKENIININLTKKMIDYSMKTVGTLCTPTKKKILVDFSSPNIAKEMHVGHLRSTIIGDSICRLYELQGHEVSRINHVGDFGLQFGMIIQYLLEICPDYLSKELTIQDLQIFYAQSKKKFDNDTFFREMAYKKVVLLQSGDPEIVNAWNFLKDISRISYNDIYRKLDIHIFEVGESFYQIMIPDIINELDKQKILVENDGRKIIKLDEFDLPLTIVKSDGGFTYDTTDIAALKYRLVDLNMDEIIYVVDNGQSLHFNILFAIARKMKWQKDCQVIKHIGFGLVLDEQGKK